MKTKTCVFIGHDDCYGIMSNEIEQALKSLMRHGAL